MGKRLSEDCKIALLETTDIGGTNAATGWLSMKNFNRVMAYLEIGTWNAGDDLDTCKLQQAINASGSSAKDLTTSGSGSNYDTSAPVDADGNFVVIEAKAEDMDIDNGFEYVRAYVAETGNTGTDNITGFLMIYEAAYPQKEQIGAASAGAQVYVDPTT